MVTKGEKESAGIFDGSKKIVTDRCRNCPLIRYRATIEKSDTNTVCTHASTDGWKLYDLDLIPIWCPLEDD